MGTLTIRALRVVLAVALAGSVFVQVVMVPLFWADLDDAPAWGRISVIAIMLAGIVCLQVIGVCVWRLLTLVRRGTVFSHASFRYVDVVICSIAVAALLPSLLGVLLAPGDTAPGIVLLLGGATVVVAAVALLVLVLRMLLAQAVALDTKAHDLQAELDEVI